MGSFMNIFLLVLSCIVLVASAGNFNQDFEVTFGQERTEIAENGNQLTLTLDPNSGSGFRSNNAYLFGKIDMKIKLVPGNSAGTVTTYYLRSEGENWDEIDFEFLGNTTGDPYTIHTNVFTQGQGGREQQFRVWFDPTSDFHTYSVLWNPQRIVFYVDGTPIREFMNMEGQGVAFPKSQPMRIYASLWDAEDWATRGGNVKTDWSQAPFRASFRDFNVNADQSSGFLNEQLGTTDQQRLANIQQNFMIYNYCVSAPQNHPECNTSGGNSGASAGGGDGSSS